MTLLAVYAVGVALGIAMIRDRWPLRIAAALCWPLGPVAFVAVVSLMLVVATLLWPAVLVPAWAILAAVLWLIV